MDLSTPQILIQLAMGLIYAVPTVSMIIIAIYYLRKVGLKIEGLLILIGNVIILLAIILNQLSMLFFVHNRIWEPDTYTYLITANNIFSFIGSIVFVIGLFLMVKKALKNSKKS